MIKDNNEFKNCIQENENNFELFEDEETSKKKVCELIIKENESKVDLKSLRL